MTAPATLSAQRRGEHAIVTVRGELDVFNAADMTAAIEDAVAPDAHGVVLDLTEVGFLDSTAIRKLFALTGRLAERRQSVHIVTPEGSMVLRTLQLVEFSRAAPMHDSLADALAHVDAQGAAPG